MDDDGEQLFLTQQLVKRCGRENPVVGLAGGPEAIAYLERCGEALSCGAEPIPAVVLLDLCMPVVDGLDVLRWVRAHPKMGAVCVIMLTSSDDPEDVKRCTESGAQGYLVKHPSALVMGCVLRQALDEKAPMIRSTAPRGEH